MLGEVRDEVEAAGHVRHEGLATAPSTDLRIEAVPDLDAARDDWSPLAESAGNVFATWEWASAWWAQLGEGFVLRVSACRRADGSVAAILPLCLATKGPVRAMRFLGHGPADQLGPVCAPHDRAAAARALEGALAAESSRVDLLLAERLAGSERWPERLGGTVLRTEASPTIRIDGASWEDLLASRSANFRQQVRRRERKLARDHGLRFRLSEGEASLDRDLELLFELHDRRWAGRSGAFSPARRAFHRSFARLALERGWLRLCLAEVEGRPVAAWYGFRFGQVESYYQAGRDPGWDHSSVGFVLMAHTIREACTDGMREYRLLLGDEPYKDRFATDEGRLETIALPRTRTGRAALAGASATRRLPGKPGRMPGWLIDRGMKR
jgi:CelD/BcsL family acetyltransferase involved in cellulose biosynthesis